MCRTSAETRTLFQPENLPKSIGDRKKQTGDVIAQQNSNRITHAISAAISRSSVLCDLAGGLQRFEIASCLCDSTSLRERGCDLASEVPALLRSTKLYRVASRNGKPTNDDRPVMPSELYGMQLLPVNLPRSHYSCRYFSEEELAAATALSMQVSRALAGNGMNIAAVGAVIIWVLVFIEKEALAARHRETRAE